MSRIFLLVIVLGLALSFFRLGSVTLFDVDEAVFAEATKELVQSGDWITPTYNGENRYDKPILFYWLMAVPYKVFGIHEFSARFPSAVAGFLLVLALFLFLRRLRDEKTALYAALSFMLSLYFFGYSHAAVTDMTLTLFITVSLMLFYLSTTADENPKMLRWYTDGFYLFSGLALLTKGLIGILFPFGIAVSYLFITGGKEGVKKVLSLRGAMLFLVVSAPWYIAEGAINGKEFVQQFFIKHHFARYTGIISGHRGPLYYYIPALIIGLFPWIAFLPAGIRNLLKERDRLSLFAVLWFAFIGIFFSFSTTKLPNYILPAVPALSILIASGMMSSNSTWIRWAHASIVLISLAMGIASLVSVKYLPKLGIADSGLPFAVSAVLLIMAAVHGYAGITKKRFYAVAACLMIVFLGVLSVKVTPVANEYLQGTLHRYSLYARERMNDGDRLIAYRLNNPSILFYSGHRLVTAGSREDLLPFLNAGTNLLAIAKVKDVEVLRGLGFTLVKEDGQYAILEKRNSIAERA
ncbi:MAG TPA: glycosyltransferase family 39 protein [Thermodesulfovibrionales bacterium]|nr:glycosyltransferase family 39 protein [Thermodesulfovibrionales bacterium]